MSKLFLVLCIFTISNISMSQNRALTDDGREVLLFPDGSWKYLNDSSNNSLTSVESLATNKNKFIRTGGATFLVKSTNFNVGVFMNPSKWTFNPHADNEKSPEYRFNLKSGEGYAIMLTEKNQIELESLREIALTNARRASLDIKETSAEYRIVNNKKVLCLKFKGTVKGIKLVYFGYYYSNLNGTVQLLSYSTQQYFDGVQNELENFLNGLVEIEK